MRRPVDSEFMQIAREIVAEGKSEAEWDEVASCDMFQIGSYFGGFESLEDGFTFSWIDGSDEYWFQLSLREVHAVAAGELDEITMRPAEK